MFLQFGNWKHITLPAALPSFFYKIIFINSANSVFENFDILSDNIKTDVYLYTFVLAFNFPLTTHNIVVGALLYVFFSLFFV